MFFDRHETGQHAFLVDIVLQRESGRIRPAGEPVEQPDTLGELRELAEAAALSVVADLSLRRREPHAKWFLGSGQLEQLQSQMIEHGADLVIINRELKPAQQRNLERFLSCRVITRTELILEIFAQRASTHEGQLQVELAQLTHAQTRLVKGWTHLDRQKGGIGLRGAGEKQIELDQRMLARRIGRLKQRLDGVRRQRRQSRRRRMRNSTPTIALVGYTNVGKSTLFNRLTNAEVLVQNQLFATLDPTLRQVTLPGAGDLILADTVGFIRNLPHTLVEAFKATLEELAKADLLLHVMDASAEDMDERRDQVLSVLAEIGAGELPILEVYNKCDLVRDRTAADGSLEPDWWNGSSAAPGRIQVSATTGYGLEQLKAALVDRIGVDAITVVLSPEAGRTRAWLHDLGAVVQETALSNGQMELTVRLTQGSIARLQQEPGVMLGTTGRTGWTA